MFARMEPARIELPAGSAIAVAAARGGRAREAERVAACLRALGYAAFALEGAAALPRRLARVRDEVAAIWLVRSRSVWICRADGEQQELPVEVALVRVARGRR